MLRKRGCGCLLQLLESPIFYWIISQGSFFFFPAYKSSFGKSWFPHSRQVGQVTFPMWGQKFNANNKNKDRNLLEVFPQKQNGMPRTLALSEIVVKLIASPGYLGWNPASSLHTPPFLHFAIQFIWALESYILLACVLDLKEAGKAWRKWSQDDHRNDHKVWFLSILIV